MTSEEQGSHADGAPPPSDVPEPSLAEKAKTLLVQGGHSTLSTMSRKHAGFPFGSLMPYGLTELGEPIFLVSSMAMHTKNLKSDPHATLLVVQTTDENPLGAGRLSLMGLVREVEDAEFDTFADAYVDRNPAAKAYLRFSDFGLFRMELVDVYMVAGFGVMGWIAADEFKRARPDPLADVAVAIIQHMNEDHRDALVSIARFFGRLAAQDAELTAIDRLGFNMRVQTNEGMKGLRLAYPHPSESTEQVRTALTEMARAARSS